jgi:hypothetical protein
MIVWSGSSYIRWWNHSAALAFHAPYMSHIACSFGVNSNCVEEAKRKRPERRKILLFQFSLLYPFSFRLCVPVPRSYFTHRVRHFSSGTTLASRSLVATFLSSLSLTNLS